jgi:hypothetical protein
MPDDEEAVPFEEGEGYSLRDALLLGDRGYVGLYLDAQTPTSPRKYTA